MHEDFQVDDGVLLSFHACARQMKVYRCNQIITLLAEEDPDGDDVATNFDVMVHTYLLQYFDASGHSVAEGANTT